MYKLYFIFFVLFSVGPVTAMDTEENEVSVAYFSSSSPEESSDNFDDLESRGRLNIATLMEEVQADQSKYFQSLKQYLNGKSNDEKAAFLSFVEPITRHFDCDEEVNNYYLKSVLDSFVQYDEENQGFLINFFDLPLGRFEEDDFEMILKKESDFLVCRMQERFFLLPCVSELFQEVYGDDSKVEVYVEGSKIEVYGDVSGIDVAKFLNNFFISIQQYCNLVFSESQRTPDEILDEMIQGEDGFFLNQCVWGLMSSLKEGVEDKIVNAIKEHIVEVIKRHIEKAGELLRVKRNAVAE